MTNDTLHTLIQEIDRQRQSQGFHPVGTLLDLNDHGNTILDPFSTLISSSVIIGRDNVFYPNVMIITRSGGTIEIADGNIFLPSTSLLAEHGSISVGSRNQFGDGGVSIKANVPGSRIVIENDGRYLNGIQILGRCSLGSGSQIIGGPITVQDCSLGSGEAFTHPDPDLRGAVLKGFGLARGLSITRGEVLNGSGAFDTTLIERQSFYHPRRPREDVDA